MSHSEDDKINMNDKEDVLLLFNEIKEEYPMLDELAILGAVANIAGWETPPTVKSEGKMLVLKILRVHQ